ncbi:MAG TPA: S8 family serine peptidase [Opitutus sp.]|nr:S8 family serine peptidase [Opitutus sp.]
MLLRSSLLLLASVSLLRAAGESPNSPFSAKELAQGYRDHVVLAQPLESARASAGAAERREGYRVRRTFARMHDLRVLELDPSDTPVRAISRLQATGRYRFVEPDYIRHVAVEPDDPAYANGSMWGLHNTGANGGVAGADVDAPAAWDVINDASSVIVAVVDSGIKLTHQDIAPNLWTNSHPTAGDLHGANFVGGGGNIHSGDPTDDNGHGTHVAGTIGAAGNNGVASVGIAWKVQLMAVKVLNSQGYGYDSEISAGIDYAVEHGAKVINASYGGSGRGAYSNTELAALKAARDAGVIFVAAAGNESSNLDVQRSYPANFAVDNIVTVGASDFRDQPAAYSNYGAAVDLFAPGSDIVSLDYQTTSGTTVLSGTSMATPHVTGALALLKAHFPADTYRQLINRLLRGAEPSVNPSATFASECQTGGRLNLYKALTTTTNRPFNDDFADRPRLNHSNLSIRSSNTGATAESGEPAHAGSAAHSSLWWEWTAPASGSVSIDTTGSDYDTVLSIYTGSSLATLHEVASNDDSDGVASRITFDAVSGTTYEIAVDGKAGGNGLTLLTLGTTPANDPFATPEILTGMSARADGTNAQCTRETGEPKINNYTGGTSLWYRWTAPVSGRFQVAVTTADFDPLLAVYTGTALASLTAVATADGTAASGVICSFDAIAGTTYAITVDAKSKTTLGQFSLTLNDTAWQAVTGYSVTGSAAVNKDGRIFFGSDDGFVYAFQPDGSQKWSHTTAGYIDTCAPAVGDDSTVYIGSSDGYLYAFTAIGTVKWKHSFGASVSASDSPALASDGTIYIKAEDGFLHALNPSNGSEKWKTDLQGITSYASPSVAADGTIYQGVEGGVLYALNPADGSEKWHYATDTGEDIFTVPAIDADGNLYFSVLGTGKLYSLTAAGAKRWAFDPGTNLSSSSSPALSADGSTAYYAGYDGMLYAIDTATGEKRWSYTLGGEVRASSPAVDANGVIYIGCYDGRLYAINADGTLNRHWDTGDSIRSSPVIFGHMLYVGSNDAKLYAIDIGAETAGGPWPQFRRNYRHTGRGIIVPAITTQPASRTAAAGGSVTLTAATSAPGVTYQWQRNGADVSGATGSSLTLSNLQSGNAGIYTVTVTGETSVVSSPAVVGVTTTKAAIGNASVVGTGITHPNGNIYDQVLLTGASASITAAAGHATRISYLDLNDDIVQVEFSGHGTLTLSLDDASGPAAPTLYHQPDVAYMKGHARIVIAGADETTNVLVFSVGRLTAFDPSGTFNFLLPISDTNDPANNGSPLFTGHPVADYDGYADIASIAIVSTNGKFGGVRLSNTHCWASTGLTGLYAPGVALAGPAFVGNIDAFDAATPVLQLGSVSDARITGGDLFQDNGAAVQVSGITQLVFSDGYSSQGTHAAAQANQAVLEENGVDVTDAIVVNPGH